MKGTSLASVAAPAASTASAAAADDEDDEADCGSDNAKEGGLSDKSSADANVQGSRDLRHSTNTPTEAVVAAALRIVVAGKGKTRGEKGGKEPDESFSGSSSHSRSGKDATFGAAHSHLKKIFYSSRGFSLQSPEAVSTRG